MGMGCYFEANNCLWINSESCGHGKLSTTWITKTMAVQCKAFQVSDVYPVS